MNDINVYLIRHGESTANANGLDQIGQEIDTPLSEKGVSQANFLGHRFRNQKIEFDKMFSSTYLRARTTADIVRKIVSYKSELSLTDTLVEYNPGDWKGKHRSIIYENPKNLEGMAYKHMGFLFPDGESYHQVERRSAKFIEDAIIYNKEITDLAEKKELNIALFSHGMTVKCLLHYVMGYDQSFLWKIRIFNTSVSHLIYNDKGWFLNSINDIAHLL